MDQSRQWTHPVYLICIINTPSVPNHMCTPCTSCTSLLFPFFDWTEQSFSSISRYRSRIPILSLVYLSNNDRPGLPRFPDHHFSGNNQDWTALIISIPLIPPLFHQHPKEAINAILTPNLTKYPLSLRPESGSYNLSQRILVVDTFGRGSAVIYENMIYIDIGWVEGVKGGGWDVGDWVKGEYLCWRGRGMVRVG